MWTYNLDPVLFDVGPLEIRWYGLVYVAGFLLAAVWLKYMRKRKILDLRNEEIWDLLFYLLLGVLIGARLFMIFWNSETYLLKPWNLLFIWQGGMSFHGGFVGIVVACWWYCRKKRVDFWKVADIISVPAMLALALGRIANFVNGELVGKVWNGRWCVVFPDYGSECRHPNMIYSFFQRLIVFGWLAVLTIWKEFTPGFIFWNFVFWEGIGRFLMDFFRADTLYFSLSLGQWFSLMMIIVSVYFFMKKHRRDWKMVLGRQKTY